MTNDIVGGDGRDLSVFKQELRYRFGEDVFQSWMADLGLYSVSKEAVTFSTPSAVKADRLNQQYKRGMQSVWCERIRPVKTVNIVARARRAEATSDAVVRAHKNLWAKESPRGGAKSRWTDDRPLERQAPSEPSLEDLASPVDPTLTFDTFAVDGSNEIAHAAGRRLLDGGAGREVVYIYGPSGVGKTHLLHAIANEWAARRPDRQAAYFTHSDMRDGCSSAALSSSLRTLHRHLGARDLILIDDLHLLKTCRRTQEEILNLCDAAPSAGRRVVIAGEMPPGELNEAGINRRLTDRLLGGLPAPIEPGGERLRVEVLMKRRAQSDAKCVIGDDAVEFVAQNFPRSMRDAIGAFNQLVLTYGGEARVVDVAAAREALKSRLRERRKTLSLEALLEETAAQFGLTVADMTGRAQPQRIVRARHAFVRIGRDCLAESFPRLGRALKRDHTTCMSSYERAEALFERYADFRERIAAIKAAFGL